jgi:hypothetical protein
MNNDKICLVNQCLGIGDVFFCQSIGRYFKDKGYRVIWPLASQIMYIKNYIEDYGIEFVDRNSDFPGKYFYKDDNPLVIEDNFVFLPLANASHRIPNSTIMYAKYELLNLDFNIWRDGFNFKRNKEKEDELYYNILGLKDNESYVFLNKYYGTPPYITEAPFHINTEDRILQMNYVEGFTLFDWCKVIENASLIVTVDTSFQYLMEKMNNLKATDFYCYPRDGRDDYAPKVNKIFKINWKFFT